jgi:hypothetical protein
VVVGEGEGGDQPYLYRSHEASARVALGRSVSIFVGNKVNLANYLVILGTLRKL